MAERLRRLNSSGIARFRSYLDALRGGGREQPSRQLLTDAASSEPLDGDASVEAREFKDRLELARYLMESLGDDTAADEDVGLWSWLSVFYFDQVCPPKADGTRSPGRDYRHILDPGFRYGHRHLLAGPFTVYRLHGEDARLLLSTKVDVENHFHHQLASRQAFITNPAILGAVNELYQDPTSGRPKRGAQQVDRPGNLLRFIDVVQQLDVNYDLYSMTPDGILGLLPPEFDAWKRRQRRLFGRRTER